MKVWAIGHKKHSILYYYLSDLVIADEDFYPLNFNSALCPCSLVQKEHQNCAHPCVAPLNSDLGIHNWAKIGSKVRIMTS